MNTITINDIEYINSEGFFIKAPIYCKNSRNGRELIKKKKITDFIFVKLDGDKWILSDGKSRKCDKLFFTKTFVYSIHEVNEEIIIINDDTEIAPDIINLEDKEKFKDENNNNINIETRGKRYVDGIYFKVTDVMIGFEIENLNKIIITSNTIFKEDEHYKYFNCKRMINKTIKIKKELFLTYEGVLIVLLSSYSNVTNQLIDRLLESFFILHLGSTNKKEELICNIFNINIKVFKELFNTSANTLPCIYLFTLGLVKDLRVSMNIDSLISDDSIVAKYGISEDLSRQTSKYIATFGKVDNCNLKLKFHNYIDLQFIPSSESHLKIFFDSLKINFEYKNNDELVIIPKNLITLVENQYQQIGKKHMGHISELVAKSKELEDNYQKLSLTHQIELQNEKIKNEIQIEKFKNEIQKEKYEKELLKKDIEIMKIQLLNFNK